IVHPLKLHLMSTTFSANREAVTTFSPGLPLRLPCEQVVIYHPTATRLRQFDLQGKATCLNLCPRFTSTSSTKNHQPFLRDQTLRTRLHAQLGGISKTLGCAPILTGGV